MPYGLDRREYRRILFLLCRLNRGVVLLAAVEGMSIRVERHFDRHGPGAGSTDGTGCGERDPVNTAVAVARALRAYRHVLSIDHGVGIGVAVAGARHRLILRHLDDPDVEVLRQTGNLDRDELVIRWPHS